MDNSYIEGLKARLVKLDEERSAILTLLEVWGESPPLNDSTVKKIYKATQSFSVSGRIIDATVELIHKLGRPVKNADIMEFVKEKQLTLGNTATPDRMLSAILSNEAKKKDGRIKSAARGYWEIKQ